VTSNPIEQLEWWQHDRLTYRGGSLHLGNRDLTWIARLQRHVPAFVYDIQQISNNFARPKAAVRAAGIEGRYYFAIKSNRHPVLLGHLAAQSVAGADVCSPQEALYALQCGFREADISYTGTAVTDADLEVTARLPDMWVNCDSLSQIRRLGALCPGREVGIRVNPSTGLGTIHYGGEKSTKFGIYRSEFRAALELARTSGLKVAGLHWHLGWGFDFSDASALDKALTECRWFVDQVQDLARINIGGGLGVPLRSDERAPDLEAWAKTIARHLRGYGAKICFEPGTLVAMDSGVLVMTVAFDEVKNGRRFVYVNGGFNLNPCPAFYDIRLPIVPVTLDPAIASDAGVWTQAAVAGNINEAIDVFAEDVWLPPLHEGDAVAMLFCGAYGASMASNHCMRGQFSEYCLV
jgi:diaminopimelate decarboxylase